MTAPVQIGAAKLATDTAGYTGTAPSLAAQGPEPLPAMFEPAGQLEHLLTGGIHPEALPTIVWAPLERASDSIRGPHGGLAPLKNGVLANGPAGGSAAAAQVAQATTAGLTTARSWLGRQLDTLRRANG
jgi:hypothetical protein